MANTLMQLAGLDERQRKFVDGLMRGLSPHAAAEAAGFSHSHGQNAMRAPWLLTALAVETQRRLRIDASTIAIRVLRELATDSQVNAGIRAKCAMAIMDRAGFVAPKQGAATGERDLAEMSQAELLETIQAAETVLSSRAKDVSAPIGAVPVAQEPDIFE